VCVVVFEVGEAEGVSKGDVMLRLSPECADLDSGCFGRVAPSSSGRSDGPSSAEVWGECLDGLGEGVVVGRWCEIGGHGSIVGDLSQRRKSLVGVGLRCVVGVSVMFLGSIVGALGALRVESAPQVQWWRAFLRSFDTS
jgi:hypothetical protein